MNRLEQIQDSALALLAFLGAIATLALMAHVALDITLRNLFNSPIPATFEVVTHYYMVSLAFIPLAWVEKSGGMISVEFIDGFLSPRTRRVSDRLVSLVTTLVYALLAWVTLQTALTNMARGSFLMANQTRVLTWPAYWIPPLGFGLAALVVFIRLISPIRDPRVKDTEA
ncbi:TRAP transporter small permease [Pararhodobacter marinus]|uniref:TRAP transporter small permease protein n=1 Tax=Pararhodobacter marinus TaxID=2184063 RepID=A0A2U2CBG6_9RHOB|nr:TRAP transporter small permease [Pararhodobacter marinus]PWE29124.1 TRAP transporter small permease [Pararhodobacter marinus]